MRTRLIGVLVLAITIAMLGMIVPAVAYFSSVTYGGEGFPAEGPGSHTVVTKLCGISNDAETDDPYLLWVLTATGASNAEISGPWGTAMMTRTGNGTFEYVSGWYAADRLIAFPVKATHDGRASNATLVVRHGCPPFNK